MTGKRVVITGGVGAIGINLTKKILESDPEKIIILDNESSGASSFLPTDKRIDFKKMDIADKQNIQSILNEEKADYIFHLAAHFANQNSVDHPYKDIETNIIGTLNLLDASLANKNLKKFVYASSSCVYGDSEVMRESDYIYPYETPYAINKYAAEMYVKYFAHLHKLPTVSVRIFNTYGPYELPGKYRNVIPNFIDKALRNEDLVITGNGEETRDFTYVEDTVQLLLLGAQSGIADGDYFNGGTGKEVSVKELAEKIIALSGSRSKIVFQPRRTWDLVTRRLSDITKSKNLLGYQPEVPLDSGLRQTIAWHKKQLDNQG